MWRKSVRYPCGFLFSAGFWRAHAPDADALRLWINNDPDVAWIIKISERENEYDWKAANAIDSLPEQQSALWHVRAGPLTIPSARVDVTDAIVANPFQGWTQVLGHAGATCPWFGSNIRLWRDLYGDLHHTSNRRVYLYLAQGAVANSTASWR